MASSSFGSIRNLWIVFIFLSSFVFAVPAVNLKGVDSVDSGAFSYSLALDVPPGIAGVAPQISLAYSSNSGNGYLGQGWSISGLSSISRCGSTQLYNRYNRAVRYDDRDRFCMDGQQLVKVDDNEYRTKIESYAKITASGDEDNPDKFTIKMKSGDIYTYSYVDEIKGKNAVWYLTQISDRFKNSIDFYYLSGEFPTQLTEIRYSDVKIKFNYSGAREDKIEAYSFGKQIVLDEKLKEIQISVDSQYYKKYLLEYHDQEDKERLKLKSIQECVSGGGCTNPLTFGWRGTNQFHPYFVSTKYKFPDYNVGKDRTKFADFNGDGFTDIYISGNKVGYVYLNNQKGSFSGKSYEILASAEGTFLIDIDNDGDIDIYDANSNLDDIWINNGSGSFSKSKEHPNIEANNHNIQFVDIDQDGDLDLIEWGHKGGKTYLSKNKGNGTFETTKIYLFRGANSTDQLAFSDFNDDGQLDIIHTTSETDYYITGSTQYGFQIHLNDGSENFTDMPVINNTNPVFVHTQPKTYFIDFNGDNIIDVLSIGNLSSKLYLARGDGEWDEKSLGSSYGAKEEETTAVDLNGDGFVDILKKNGSKINVWQNKGNATFTTSSLSINVGTIQNLKFADLNGDGLLDIYEIDGGDDNIWLNQGDFSFIQSSTHPNILADQEYVQLADMNGDGIADIVNMKQNEPIYINKSQATVINRVEDSFGQGIGISYENLTDSSIYKKDTQRGTDVYNLQTPMLVVSSISNITGYADDESIQYRYEGLKFHRIVGSLGFKKIQAISSKYDDVKVDVTETEYYQSFPLVGMVKESKVGKASAKIKTNSNLKIDTLISNISTDYEVIKKKYGFWFGVKQYIIQTASQTEESYESGTIKNYTSYDEYDSYGNVVKMTTKTIGNGEAYTKVTTNQYTNNAASWILGRLTDSEVKHCGGVGGCQTRKSSFGYYSNGMLKSETIEPDHKLALTKSYKYDDYGNIKEEKISAPSLKEDRITSYEYDDNGQFLTKTTNPLGHSNAKDTVYDKKTRKIRFLTDANGQTTQWEYDPWGRVTKETRPDTTTTTTTYTLDSSYSELKRNHKGYNVPYYSAYSITMTTTGSPSVKTYYDAFGRQMRTITKRFDGENIYQDSSYNSLGQIVQETLPYAKGESKVYTTYEYDDLGRGISTTRPSPDGGSATTTISYNGLITTTIDPRNHKKKVTKNILGKIVKVEEEGSTINYTYDSIGNLKSTVPNNNDAYQIVMKYDLLGNKTYMNDPDMGEWNYKYDALGELISQTDANKQVTDLEYDKLGRKTKETITKADGEVEQTNEWHYDTSTYGLGKLSKESTGSSGIRKEYFYNPNGTIKTVKSVIKGKTFNQSYIYNSDGKIYKTTQPNGLELINVYNEQGYLEAIKSPAAQIEDFDIDHFIWLVEEAMQQGLMYYEKSLELSDKANKLRATAKKYENRAKDYKEDEAEFRQFAKELRADADEYEALAKKYEGYALEKQSLVKHYQGLADKYRKKWWTKALSAIYQTLANLFNSQAKNYASISESYLNKAKEADEEASDYEDQVKQADKQELYYLKKAKDLYAQAKALDAQAKTYKKLSDQLNFQEDVAGAYEEILDDDKYVYHYKVLEQDSLGHVTKYLSGNGLVTEDSYDSSGVMTESATGYTFDKGVRELHYEYDANFNLTHREDKILGVVQNYLYDRLDRIDYSTIDGSKIYGSKAFDYKYDVYGNLTFKEGTTITYRPGTHQVKSAIDSKGKALGSYQYDPNGNMLKSGASRVSYDALNRPSIIQEGDQYIAFKYDMNGDRYFKSDNNRETLYVGKTYEYIKNTKGEISHKNLIYANGRVVTIHSEGKENGKTFYETRYLHYDSLGSVDTITGQQGQVVQRMAYKPFGEQIDVDIDGDELKRAITNRGYTGHEHIEGTGLIHMNARVYDPSIGRFLSADTIIQDPYDTQSFNRYSYVRNNPMKYTDPTGHLFSGVVSWLKKRWTGVREYVKYGLVLGHPAVQNYIAEHQWAQIAGGIVAGLVGGPAGAAFWSAYTTDAQGGNFAQVAGVGLTAYVSAGLASNIGDAYGHNSSFFTVGSNVTGTTTTITTRMAFEKAVMHGIVRGMVHAGQGGKFGSGFASGFVSSAFSIGAEVGDTNAVVAGKTAIMAVVGGTASNITGGKFANGAVSATFIYLYNEINDPRLNGRGVPAAMGGDANSNSPINFGTGIGAGVHLGLVGVNAHYDILNGTCNVCARIGPGAYIGGGAEVYGYGTYGESTSEYFTGGLGADIMLGYVGEAGGINGNFDTTAITYGTRYGLGFGGSIGIDLCVNW